MSFSVLKAAQLSKMDDVCHIYRVSRSSGTYSTAITETRTLAYSGTPCGIRFTDGRVAQNGQVQFLEYDCLLRVTDDVTILMTDEIELVEKGEFQISGTFKPASAPVVNSSVQKVKLKRQVP